MGSRFMPGATRLHNMKRVLGVLKKQVRLSFPGLFGRVDPSDEASPLVGILATACPSGMS